MASTTTVFPSGNICPSGKIAKSGLVCRGTNKTDVLGFGGGNYGHNSIVRRGGEGVNGGESAMAKRAIRNSGPEKVKKFANGFLDWQARVRAEVLEICGDKPLNNEMLRNMKVLKMVIQEVLRLYALAVFVTREAFETVTLKNIVIPKGVQLQIPVPFLHQNPDLWGPDAHKFKPERFANGILAACQSPQAYMPFGNGPRICVGRHLEMTKLKVMLALILSKFSLSISPTYRDSPVYTMVVELSMA